MTVSVHDVRVVDLSRSLAGPLCGMTLGDLGASVIKVEQPGTGDETRAWGPPFDSHGQSAYFLSVNRNKLSVALDLNSGADRDQLLALIGQADVVLENFRSGTLERRGIKKHALLEGLPRLVWCTITGFGSDADRPGYDFVVQAESGWMSVTGEPSGEPMKVGIALADVMAGKDATISVLGALLARERGSTPSRAGDRYVEIALAQSAQAALVNVAQSTLVSGDDATRWGNAHQSLVPYQLFRAKDRPIVIAVGNDRQWQAACRALELTELAKDESLSRNPGRVRDRDRVVSAFAAKVAECDAAHWLDRLRDAGVPCGVVRTIRESLADSGASPLTGVLPSVPGEIHLPPPHLDQHGTLVREFGWNAFQHLDSATRNS